jgi:hypothetical protein
LINPIDFRLGISKFWNSKVCSFNALNFFKNFLSFFQINIYLRSLFYNSYIVFLFIGGGVTVFAYLKKKKRKYFRFKGYDVHETIFRKMRIFNKGTFTNKGFIMLTHFFIFFYNGFFFFKLFLINFFLFFLLDKILILFKSKVRKKFNFDNLLINKFLKEKNLKIKKNLLEKRNYFLNDIYIFFKYVNDNIKFKFFFKVGEILKKKKIVFFNKFSLKKNKNNLKKFSKNINEKRLFFLKYKKKEENNLKKKENSLILKKFKYKYKFLKILIKIFFLKKNFINIFKNYKDKIIKIIKDLNIFKIKYLNYFYSFYKKNYFYNLKYKFLKNTKILRKYIKLKILKKKYIVNISSFSLNYKSILKFSKYELIENLFLNDDNYEYIENDNFSLDLVSYLEIEDNNRIYNFFYEDFFYKFFNKYFKKIKKQILKNKIYILKKLKKIEFKFEFLKNILKIQNLIFLNKKKDFSFIFYKKYNFIFYFFYIINFVYKYIILYKKTLNIKNFFKKYKKKKNKEFKINLNYYLIFNIKFLLKNRFFKNFILKKSVNFFNF